VPVCPLFRLTGREHVAARAKLHLLDTLGPEADRRPVAALLSQCLLCGACSARCPRRIEPHRRILVARRDFVSYRDEDSPTAALVRFCLARPWLARLLIPLARWLPHRLPADSGLRLRFPSLPVTGGRRPRSIARKKNADIAIFHGCLAGWLEPAILDATVTLLDQGLGLAGRWPTTQGCCGLAALSAGNEAQARQLARRNIAAFAGNTLPILVTCASCYSHLRDYPRLLADDPIWRERARRFADRLQEFFSFFAATDCTSRLATTTAFRRIAYHDPCHLRHHAEITEPPRRLLAAIDGAELVEPAHGPQCCGQGGLFHIAHPHTAAQLRGRLLADFTTGGADYLTTSCSGCLLHIRGGLPERADRIVHPAVLLAQLIERN